MDPATGNTAALGEPIGENAGGVSPLTHSILSQAVLDAIGHTDPKLAFDMMLVNEHLTAQAAANRSLKEEVAFLKQTLAKQTHEQSEMFHYFHDKTDEHMARIAELEKTLADEKEENEKRLASSQETLVSEQCERASEQVKAQEEVETLKEELRQVLAFAAVKHEMEAYTRALETKLDAQRAAFQTQVQDLERNNLLEQARTKQELLGRMQAAKAELMLRTNDQVASTTHRTLLENEHFTQELAFQSRETEKLLERLDETQQEVSKLRAQNKVLEATEQVMAKKNRYYQKVLAKLQQPKVSDGSSAVQLQISTTGENNVDEGTKVTFALPESANVLTNSDEEKEKRVEVEAQLQRALEWLRVFQRERQFLLARQDEVIQFLYRSLDEAAEARRSKSCRRTEKTMTNLPQETADPVDSANTSEASRRVEELIQLAPSTTTMDAFGRRVLVPRPALDELSSEDAHEVLLFLLEKLHLYQVRIAAVYPNSNVRGASGSSPTSPIKHMLERQLGVELPLIATPANSSPSPSSLKQKRRIFAHVAAAVDTGNTEWLGSPRSKAAVHPQTEHSQVPLNPQLLAMATNNFNFLGQSPAQKSPTKRRYQQLHHSSFGKNPITSPPRKAQSQIQPLIPWSKDEVLTPWAGTASAASIALWDPSKEAEGDKH
ncbi:hypothetical protein PHYPSEUDO_006481 [Phytophthora pseudosyringae]|uniref:Cilia- and flagella-associated protein 157 n=1 Tax=Phytophthora pseudosyringae TaxID=221518 RepID=A0A8T1VIN2_9STRA|nr:hypothetical protein PHYPSEUDO_006481 [Phytophthora pseudosyringae]